VNVIRPEWPAPPCVNAMVSTRPTGNMAFGGEGRNAIQAFVPAEPVWLKQVHGTRILQLGRDVPETLTADAAVTRTRGTVCAVMVADCLPVFLCDAAGTAVAVAHAGWRGLCAGVLEASVAALGMSPQAIRAWLGPAIGPRVYEVGDEVRDAFVAQDSRARSAFSATRPGHWLLDLYAVARQRLEGAGVAAISGGGFCTYSETERFFSFRRERTAARMAALIWLA
jgi:YfiH family protein